MQNNFPVSAKWIWTEAPTASVNAYVQFFTEFTGRTALLRIAVSGNYAAYVNGHFAAFGQYTDYPEHKTYSETDISSFCREGRNELLIEVHYSGNDFSSHTDGEPGLIAEVLDGEDILAASDSKWLSRIDTRYAQGLRPKLFVSLNYNYAYDAREVLPEWHTSVTLPPRGEISLRPVPPLPTGPFTPLSEVRNSGGSCFRMTAVDSCASGICAPSVQIESSCGRTRTEAEGEFGVQGSEFSVQSTDNAIIYDAGEETTGLLEFELVAHSGAIVEIAHAEYLVDGKLNPAATANGKNFIDTYVCKEGTNTFFHPLRRLGGRYFELRIKGDVAVKRFGLRPVVADLPTPEFSCSDKLFEKAHVLSARTLRLCHHEKYENCPWREQSICAADARNQMLFGYGFWGNYDWAAAMLDLFAQGVKDNGFVPAAVPMSKTLWIPNFTFQWMLAVHEHVLYSGSASVFERHADLIEWMFGKILASKCDGLWLPPDDPDRWDYGECGNLEWNSDPPNAIYNLYMREAMMKLSPRFRRLGRTVFSDSLDSAATEMISAFRCRFWNSEIKAYADRINGKGEYEGFLAVIQVLALLQGLVPEGFERQLFERVRDGEFGEVALPTMPYLIRLVHEYGNETDKEWLHEKIRSVIRTHLNAGATTWWEDIRGTGYAGGAGSLCHGWSAFEAWYETEYLLGIRPFEDGVFEIKPWRPRGMEWCRGVVITPKGIVKNPY